MNGRFNDSAKRSLKTVVRNGNKYASVPVGESVHLNEFRIGSYKNIIQRERVGGFRVLCVLLSQQNRLRIHISCVNGRFEYRVQKHWHSKCPGPEDKNILHITF